MTHTSMNQTTPALPQLSSYLPPISFDTNTPSFATTETTITSSISVMKDCQAIEIAVTPTTTPRFFESVLCKRKQSPQDSDDNSEGVTTSRLNRLHLDQDRRGRQSSSLTTPKKFSLTSGRTSPDIETTVYIAGGLPSVRTPRRERTSRYLSEGDRREIITRIDSGEKQVSLAREFSVSRAAICNLYKNRWEVLTRGSRDSQAKHPKKSRSRKASPRLGPTQAAKSDQKSEAVPVVSTVYADTPTKLVKPNENPNSSSAGEHPVVSSTHTAYQEERLTWTDAHMNSTQQGPTSPCFQRYEVSRAPLVMSDTRATNPIAPTPFLVHEASAYSYPCKNLVAMLRDENISTPAFQKQFMRLIRLLLEEVLACLPHENVEIKNQHGDVCFVTKAMEEADVCAVSMENKGMVLLRAFSDISPTSPTGFISIKPYVHAQLPPIGPQQVVLLLDMQCTTGEDVCTVLNHLVKNRQISPRNIYFVTIISSFEGLQNVHRNFPDVALITAQVDTVLDQEQRIRPGIGDFMQRCWNVCSN